ncbi:unnamed protein product [Cyprideis torosa]|uniref:Uncharacterized protein n=1 Tax=Cyprideis torosa TaxID=163714 RepID=A0A7R8WSF5_9CRUS|nr:unnamed protein product [Cyprideis torosa]CAG0904757.1 unnamed protein product [Cyprideis torosa]
MDTPRYFGRIHQIPDRSQFLRELLDLPEGDHRVKHIRIGSRDDCLWQLLFYKDHPRRTHSRSPASSKTMANSCAPLEDVWEVILSKVH